MYKVTKSISFCFGHRLLNYDGPCRHPHGHNVKAEVDLCGEALGLSHTLVRFEDVKEIVKSWIDRELDHKMLLNRKDPLVEALRKMDEPYFLMDSNPTAEAIAKLIFDYAKGQKLPVTEVRVWENQNSCAAYREV